MKGRHWIAIWLVATLLALLVVARRQHAGLQAAAALDSVRTVRAALEAEQARLMSAIGEARSRRVLLPLARERLGLRLPHDSEILILRDRP